VYFFSFRISAASFQNGIKNDLPQASLLNLSVRETEPFSDCSPVNIYLFILFTGQYEMGIFLVVFVEINDQLMETHVVGDALHRRYIKHIRQASVADGEYLFL